MVGYVLNELVNKKEVVVDDYKLQFTPKPPQVGFFPGDMSASSSKNCLKNKIFGHKVP